MVRLADFDNVRELVDGLRVENSDRLQRESQIDFNGPH
jgi:hypothetical protein